MASSATGKPRRSRQSGPSGIIETTQPEIDIFAKSFAGASESPDGNPSGPSIALTLETRDVEAMMKMEASCSTDIESADVDAANLDVKNVAGSTLDPPEEHATSTSPKQVDLSQKLVPDEADSMIEEDSFARDLAAINAATSDLQASLAKTLESSPQPESNRDYSTIGTDAAMAIGGVTSIQAVDEVDVPHPSPVISTEGMHFASMPEISTPGQTDLADMIHAAGNKPEKEQAIQEHTADENTSCVHDLPDLARARELAAAASAAAEALAALSFKSDVDEVESAAAVHPETRNQSKPLGQAAATGEGMNRNNTSEFVNETEHIGTFDETDVELKQQWRWHRQQQQQQQQQGRPPQQELDLGDDVHFAVQPESEKSTQSLLVSSALQTSVSQKSPTAEVSVEEWFPPAPCKTKPGNIEVDKDPTVLEQQLCRQRIGLAQVRLDYESRVQRCTELSAELKKKEALINSQPKQLRLAIEREKKGIETQGFQLEGALMNGEDSLSRSQRLLEAKDKEIKFFERRINILQQNHQRLQHLREPVADNVAREVLREKGHMISALKADKLSQADKISALTSDIRKVLDFMMCVHIDAAGGPRAGLTAEDFLPKDAREKLRLSKHGSAQMVDLTKKYEACIARLYVAEMMGDPTLQEMPTDQKNDMDWPKQGSGTTNSIVEAVKEQAQKDADRNRQNVPQVVTEIPEHVHEPYHCIRAIGRPEAPKDFISYTVAMLGPPVRDSTGFMRNSRAKALAQLTPEENDLGVWSEHVVHYTHAGLEAALEASNSAASPTHPEKSRQAMVLTCERLLFHNTDTWALVQVIELREIEQLILSPCSNSVLLIRLERRPDLLLDVGSRDRFIEELRLSAMQRAERWGGRNLGEGGLGVIEESGPITPLLGRSHEQIGTLAFVEADVFLILPFEPNSLMLGGNQTICFGFLDLQRTIHTANSLSTHWKWQLHFFLLKGGPANLRKLAWCHHPNDELSAGEVFLDNIRQVRLLDTPQGDLCLVIDHVHPASRGKLAPPITVRAASAASREEWAATIRALQDLAM